MKRAYLVLIVGYDQCSHLGAFSTREAAEEYREDVSRGVDMGEVVIEELVLDMPRGELRGVYEVEIDAEGEVVREGWADYTTPDHEWRDEDVVGAHWWRGPDGPVPADDGSVIRAVGINREQALARALNLLGLSPDSENGPTP